MIICIEKRKGSNPRLFFLNKLQIFVEYHFLKYFILIKKKFKFYLKPNL